MSNIYEETERAIMLVREKLKLAAELHPERPSLAALVEEVGEVARAMQDSPERLAEELLDVAVVALRWHMQEVRR